MNKQIVIDCQNVSKSYQDGHLNVDVLHDLNVQIQAGESVSIIGASGSGKSTLLHILGGLDTPTSGKIALMGQDLATLNQAKLGICIPVSSFAGRIHCIRKCDDAVVNWQDETQ